MTTTQHSFTTPIGRLVAGSPHIGNDKDMKGNPLVVKSGANKGAPRISYYFGVAIPKAGEQIWWQTDWGALIYQTGRNAFPQLFNEQDGSCLVRDFAWKITDGDDTRRS